MNLSKYLIWDAWHNQLTIKSIESPLSLMKMYGLQSNYSASSILLLCSHARLLLTCHWMTPSLKFNDTCTISLGWKPLPWLDMGLLLSKSWPLQLYSITLSPSTQLCLSLWRASMIPTQTPGYNFWIIPIFFTFTVNYGKVLIGIEPMRMVGKIKSSYFQIDSPLDLKCFANLAVLSIKIEASSIAGSCKGFIMCFSSFIWEGLISPSLSLDSMSKILACSLCKVS